MPNIFWMYLSLGFYLATSALVLIARRSDAAYTGAFGMYNFVLKKKKEQEAMKAFHESHRGQVVIKNSSDQEQIALCESNIVKLTIAIETNKKAFKFYYRLKRGCHTLAEITVLIATLVLFLFAIQLMQAMVW